MFGINGRLQMVGHGCLTGNGTVGELHGMGFTVSPLTSHHCRVMKNIDDADAGVFNPDHSLSVSFLLASSPPSSVLLPQWGMLCPTLDSSAPVAR